MARKTKSTRNALVPAATSSDNRRRAMRRESDVALLRSEEFFRELIENSLDAIAVVNAEGILTYQSPSFERLLGHSLEGHISTSGFKFVHPEDIPKTTKLFAQLVHNPGGVIHHELRVQHNDGSWRSVELLGRNHLDDPAVGGIVVNFHDITERKKAEKALQESEERLKRYLDYSPDVICVVDIGGTILYANATARKLIGYSSEELMGQNFLELGLLAPSDTSKPTRWLAAGGAEKPSKPNEFELVGKDGRRIIAEVLTIPLGPAPGGYKTEIIAIARDITERKQMHESLRESEERFRAITETANDAILAINAKGIIVLWNHAAEAIFGYSAAEVMGKPLTLMIPKRFCKAFQMGMKHQVSTEHSTIQGKPIELIGMRKDGSEFPIEVTTSCWTAKGETFFTAVARDITERKRIEQQLLLSGRLASVGQLAAGVAHELNNPLTAVQAYAQFLSSRKDLDETLKSDVETIYKEAQRASKITANLLSFARSYKPQKSFISINETIEKCLELHEYRMKVNNIEVVSELDVDLPMTLADDHQLQQVFVNLITNAEQAMTEAHGKGKFTIKTRKVGEMIQVTFTDDGPGMPEDDLKRIFDPFFTTKDVGKGTGLGLSICYGIVQEHGGNISAKCKPGKRTTFMVEIPVVSEDQATAEQTDSVQIEQA